jgi:four helix bundle protein
MQNDKEKFKKEFTKRLITFSVEILKFVQALRKDRNLWPVADQLVRSSTSIGANVVEAKASSSRKDYLKFFEIALKSANETKYWLIVIKEYNKEFLDETDKNLQEVDEISKIIGSSVLALKGKR